MSERHPISVAHQIKKVIPVRHQSRVDSMIRSFSYKAPEQVGECWLILTDFVNEMVPCPPHEVKLMWQKKAVSILVDRQLDDGTPRSSS